MVTVFWLMTYHKFFANCFAARGLLLVGLLIPIVKMWLLASVPTRFTGWQASTPVRSDPILSSPVQSSPCCVLTSLTGASQVARPGAVADVAVPALPADPVVLAGVGQALFGRLPGAGRLHAHRPLGLSQPPDVFALAVHKQVSDAAHVAVVQQSCPHLRKRFGIFQFHKHLD